MLQFLYRIRYKFKNQLYFIQTFLNIITPQYLNSEPNYFIDLFYKFTPPLNQLNVSLFHSSILNISYSINNKMISCCQIPRDKLEKDPKKYLKSHIMVCNLEGTIVVSSIAEKKNNTGLMYNDRFLLLHGHNALGYFNNLPTGVPLPFKSLADVPKMKVSIPLKDITTWSIDDKTLTIKYTSEVDNKKQNQQWIFKFDTIDLSKDWKHHLKRAEQQRRDSEKKSIEMNNKPPTIIGIQDQLKKGRNVVKPYPPIIISLQPEKEEQKVKQPPFIHQSSQNTKIFNDKLDKVSSIQKVDKPGSPAQSNIIFNEDPQYTDRIIDKTYTSHKKLRIPSPRSVRENQLRQSNHSYIDNVHARSPSLNSSIRQSPSSSNIIPQSNIPASRYSVINDQSVQKITIAPKQVDRQEVSPRWKQPLVSHDKWNYRVQRQNLPFVLYEFKLFSQKITKQIIDDISIGNPEVKLKRKSQVQLQVQYQGLSLVLCFCGKKQIKVQDATFVQEDNVISTINKFNNMEYIFSSLQNKIQPYVTLSSLVSYKGILVSITCNVSSSSRESVSISTQQAQRVLEKTRIMTSWDASEIVKSEQFNRIFIVQSKTFLPIFNQIQLSRNFLKLPGFQSQKYPSGSLNRGSLKSDKRIQYLSKIMIEHLKYATQCLDNFKQYVSDSKQFEQFLDSYGINQLQLGEIYAFSSNPYVKKLVGYECIFRIAKMILFNQLQMNLITSKDMSTNLIIDKNILLLNVNKSLIDTTLDFLNSMVGKFKNGQLIWEIINNQLGQKFQIYGLEVAFNEGYFLQGLVYHFNIDIDWSHIKTKRGFDPLFKQSSINSFLARSKVYNCDHHLEFKGISKLIQNKTEQSYKILLQSLDLYKSPIPQYYKLSSLYDRIKIFMSLFLSPAQQKQRLKHLQIYSKINIEPPTSASIQLQISAFKWALKQHNKEKLLALFDEITNHITMWLGPYHPFLLQIYNLLSSYYQSVGEFDEAITLAKSSIVNALKMFGGNSIKLAETYTFLADIYAAMHKYDQCLIHQKKAKSIYLSNKDTNRLQYILLLIRISRLLLHFGKPTQALEDIVICVQYFSKQPVKEEYLVSAFEIAARCYEVTKNITQHKNLSAVIAQKLINIVDPLHLQKMLKITLFYTIKQLKKESKSFVKQIIEELPKSISEQSYIDGYQYIRSCLKQERFDIFVQQILSNQKQVQEIGNSAQIRGKKSDNQKLVRLVSALRNFLGNGFITKLLN